VFYRDVSKPGDIWLVEIFSDTASKSNGVKRLRRYGDFDRIVGFGDSINDLPLFAECDECFAVENAHDLLKNAATAVIGANTDDSVAKWLFSKFSKLDK
jgi:hydroxymethylpyrimidine pyrophosphatase-like HAD family hydrolase